MSNTPELQQFEITYDDLIDMSGYQLEEEVVNTDYYTWVVEDLSQKRLDFLQDAAAVFTFGTFFNCIDNGTYNENIGNAVRFLVMFAGSGLICGASILGVIEHINSRHLEQAKKYQLIDGDPEDNRYTLK